MNMTQEEFGEFVEHLCAGLAASPLTPSARPSAEVPPHEVLDLHSETLCEDGKTVLRMWDLAGGRTGLQSFLQGETPGPIRYG